MRYTLCVLFVISLSNPVAAADLWWAAAYASVPVGPLHNAYGIYGAAWNYPTLEEAKEAALEACRRRLVSPKPSSRYGDCRLYYFKYKPNTCFYVIKSRHRQSAHIWPNVVSFGVYGPFNTITEAKADADREMAQYSSTIQSNVIELLKCTGAQ